MEVTGDHLSHCPSLSPPTAPRGAGHPGRQVPPCVERTRAQRGQLVRAQSTEGLRAGMGGKASDLPICLLLSSHVPDPPAHACSLDRGTHGLGGMQGSFAQSPHKQAAMCSGQAWLPPCRPEPYPSCCSRPPSLCPLLLLAAICTAHPFHTQAPSLTPQPSGPLRYLDGSHLGGT